MYFILVRGVKHSGVKREQLLVPLAVAALPLPEPNPSTFSPRTTRTLRCSTSLDKHGCPIVIVPVVPRSGDFTVGEIQSRLRWSADYTLARKNGKIHDYGRNA